MNKWQQKRISKIIVEKLFGTLSGKTITILGFSFKANTNDTRESPAINICKDLLEEGALLKIYDPKVSFKKIEKDLYCCKSYSSSDLQEIGKWYKFDNIEDSFNQADAIVILTEWDEFKTINWHCAYQKMRKPAWLFDTRSISNIKNAKKEGFKIWRIGLGE